MPTTGSFGFCLKGILYVVYNNWDSNPSGLGRLVVEEIQSAVKDYSLFSWSSKVESFIIREISKADLSDLNRWYNQLHFYLGSLTKLFLIIMFRYT